VLLFSARGSGDVYGGNLAHNKVGVWTQGAGIKLISEGWNVRDLQAIYPGPPVPSFPKVANAALLGGPTAVALIAKNYRDAASNSWQSASAELAAAYARCPGRPILLAGYSQGAILLRYIVPRLPAKILAKIASVDLIADPTEQRAVDSQLQHPTNLDGRLTDQGIDTFSGLILNAGSFRQTAYPAGLRGHVYQYCVSGDFVCDLSRSNLTVANAANEGKIHASYAFETVGIAAGKRIGSYSSGIQPQPAASSTPQVLRMAGANYAVGSSGPATVYFSDKECDVVGGTWYGDDGSSHDFGNGAVSPVPRGTPYQCSGGQGSFSPFVVNCGGPGTWQEAVVLRDAQGHSSPRFSFTHQCGSGGQAGPAFAVMNTGSPPPDGVWFRNSPHTADTDRVTGHGVYAGDRVQLQCYGWGDSVGSFGNTLWYYVTNISRSLNGGSNAGWLNAHYIDDGLSANQVNPGVPAC
jgi:hypothetical protein